MCYVCWYEIGTRSICYNARCDVVVVVVTARTMLREISKPEDRQGSFVERGECQTDWKEIESSESHFNDLLDVCF